MRRRWLALLLALVLAAASAKKQQVTEPPSRPLTKAEQAHRRHFFSIGEGFEGTPSDWTEYIVWAVGVCGVFAYMLNPNMRRNLHQVETDEPTVLRPGDDDVAEQRAKAE